MTRDDHAAFAALTYADLVRVLGDDPEGTVDDPVLWPVGRRVWTMLRASGMGADGKINGGTVRVFIPRKVPTRPRGS